MGIKRAFNNHQWNDVVNIINSIKLSIILSISWLPALPVMLPVDLRLFAGHANMALVNLEGSWPEISIWHYIRTFVGGETHQIHHSLTWLGGGT